MSNLTTEACAHPFIYVPRWRRAGWRLDLFLRLILITILRQLLTVWPIRISHEWTYAREITEVGVRAGRGSAGSCDLTQRSVILSALLARRTHATRLRR